MHDHNNKIYAFCYFSLLWHTEDINHLKIISSMTYLQFQFKKYIN